MSGRADAVRGSQQVVRDPEHGSGVGPASIKRSRAATVSCPLFSSLVLGALPTAPSCARLHASAVLREWGLAGVADTVELVVSELVTNAVCVTTDPDGQPSYDDAASGLPVVHLRLSSDQLHVVVEVWDTSDEAPEPGHAEPDEAGGRGLMLIEALCEHWGWETVPGWHGKVVWAELHAG
jgi:hypothetical protein